MAFFFSSVYEFTEYPGNVIHGYDGSVYSETEVNDCKTYCWEQDDCFSFVYCIPRPTCNCNTVPTMEAIEAEL